MLKTNETFLVIESIYFRIHKISEDTFFAICLLSIIITKCSIRNSKYDFLT
jgi:hypothetical protein